MVAKLKIYSEEPVFTCSGKFLNRENSDCIWKPGDTHSCRETWKQDERKFEIRRSVEFSSEAARCIPWRVDGHSNGETCRSVVLSESETWSFQEEAVTEKPIASKKAMGKRYAPSKSENWGNPEDERKEWPHNSHMSPATVPHTDAVFSIVRKIYEREPADPVEDLDVNAAIWNI